MLSGIALDGVAVSGTHLLLAVVFTHEWVTELMPQLLKAFLDSGIDILGHAAAC